MANIFNTANNHAPKRNVFDLSHERKMSLNMGDLVPIFCQEVIPGDSFRMNSEIFLRMAPMLAPIMHRVNCYTHFFFVPYRVIFNKWEPFITGGEDGYDETVFPTVLVDGSIAVDLASKGSLLDYLGVPTNETVEYADMSTKLNALPFRAYTEIYNEYYRDQNLQNKVIYDKGEGAQDETETMEIMSLRKRCWEKDYFTSALPFAQKGGEVNLPLQGDATIKMTANGNSINVYDSTGIRSGTGNAQLVSAGSDTKLSDGSAPYLKFDPNGTLAADLSTVSAATINEIRKAFQLQKWLERNARSGSRYTESILSHFGVRSSDARLQRPEYLGGGKTPVIISEVLQTSSTDGTSPQGNMSGHGVAAGNSHSFSKSFEEHGLIMGIMSVMPRTAYQQGLPRMWTKFDKFDYFWPEFAHIGEQEVKMKEVYLSYTSNPESTFGYQSRYAEYKYIPTSVHGDFKDSLLFWHMGRVFNSPPSLNNTFVQSNPTHRIFNVTNINVHKLYVQIYHNVQAIRPIPVFSEPGYIDHF